MSTRDPEIGGYFEISGYQSTKCTGNPNQDAQNFADANNLSLDEAKKILSGEYGAPQAPKAASAVKTSSGASTTKLDNSGEILTSGDSQDEEYDIAMSIDISGYVPVQSTGNPDEDAQNFADANNLSLDEAKEILSSAMGSPEQPKAKSDSSSSSSDSTSDSTSNSSDTTTTAKTYTAKQQTAIDKLSNAKQKWDDAVQKMDESKYYGNKAIKYACQVSSYWKAQYWACYNNARQLGLTDDDLSAYLL